MRKMDKTTEMAGEKQKVTVALKWTRLQEIKRCGGENGNRGGHTHINTHFKDRLTLCFGTDEAGRRVAEGAQDGSDGQAQVLITRVKSHRGEAKVRQLRGFFWTDLYVRDLRDEGLIGRKTRGKERKGNVSLGVPFGPIVISEIQGKIRRKKKNY